jgi:penicillin-binding protein 1A
MENLSDKHKKYLKIFWYIILAPLTLFILLILFISLGWIGGEMPKFEDLENPIKNLATEVYSEDGRVLGTFYYEENRNNVEYKDLSPYVVQALIAREDHRFYKHSGIDFWGLMRVFGKTIMLGNISQGGGSTISQQLAKNLFQRDTTDYRFSLVRKTVLGVSKFREWVIAVKLERNYTKEEVITMYLNTVSFGSDAYGIKAAAREYFRKSPDSLKAEEAALLIGMLKGTTRYSPIRNPKRSTERRNDVLLKMYEQDYLSKAEYDSLCSIPIRSTLKYEAQSHDAGLATYLRDYIRKSMTASKPRRSDYDSEAQFREDSLSWVDDPLYGWVYKNLKPDGSHYNLYRDGLKIYTTINWKMQEYAEQALREHLAKNVQPAFFKEKGNKYKKEKAPFTTQFTLDQCHARMLVAMRQTERYRNLRNAGYSQDEIERIFKKPVEMRVFSWKGDIDTIMSPWDSIRYHKFYLRASFMAVDPHTGYIKAYVGGPDFKHFQYDGVQQKRQVGSTIKPFLYTIAMQEGLTPCTEMLNAPVTFEVQDTVWVSKNSGPSEYDNQMVPLWFGLSRSLNHISAGLIKKFTPMPVVSLLRKLGVKSDIPAVPSLSLGVAELSLDELVGAYTAFPNKGVYTQPIVVTRIEDKNGNLLTQVQPSKSEAMNEQTAYLMTQMLRQVIMGGTGSRIRYKYNLMSEMGGKTGTTNNHSDGWFVGVTPNLIAGAWVGGEEQGIHFDSMDEGQGAAVALPIYAMFMQKVYADPQFMHMTQDVFERPSGVSIDFSCRPSKSGDETPKDNMKEEW